VGWGVAQAWDWWLAVNMATDMGSLVALLTECLSRCHELL